jgi:hypothetical protein
MLRSIRVPLLATFVALTYIACGGGGGGGDDDGTSDGGQQDGSHIQFDAQRDGAGLEGGGQEDGGGSTTCNSSGGKASDGLCKFTSDCACPGHCANIFQAGSGVAGSCNPTCASTAECNSAAAEQCVNMPDSQPICLSAGTITGTGYTSIPLLAAAPTSTVDGTANLVLAVDDLNVTFSVGWGILSSGTYYIMAYPGTASAPDVTKELMIACDSTKWSAKAYDLSKQTDGCDMRYTEIEYNQSTGAATRMTVKGFALMGTLTITAAPTATGSNFSATIANVQVIKLVQEECGSNSSPC